MKGEHAKKNSTKERQNRMKTEMNENILKQNKI